MILTCSTAGGHKGTILVNDLDAFVHAGPYDLVTVHTRRSNGDTDQHVTEKRNVFNLALDKE